MYKYNLPNIDGMIKQYETENNSLIIIGANGSGKSRLGAWIEENNIDNVHRIGAQRSLQFGDYISLKSYKQASNLLLYGEEKESNSHASRWGWNGNKCRYTTSMLSDYEYVLSAVIAKRNQELEKYFNECKTMEQEGKEYNKVPEIVTDAFTNIWNEIFPHRQIIFDDARVTTILKKDDKEIKYNGNEMSDGEKVALYLIAQALCVPENKTVIIDEPELHLHRSIMNKLWIAIENVRKDCLFIYITHDTQFAASHNQAEKIWVKEYDGHIWKWEYISESELPEQLLLDILGNRKDVLFVEGTIDSYDTKLYSEIYKDYYIIPCGSCTEVIKRTKVMNNSLQLHHLKCYGIIDRDFRSEYEMESYRSDNIFTLGVAEVENLFLVEELLQIVNQILGYTSDENIDSIKKYIIDRRFAKQINTQICKAIVSEIKYKLSTIEILDKSEENIEESLSNIYDDISYNDVSTEIKTKFNKILQERVYKKVLAVFNAKSLYKSIGQYFGIENKSYCDFIIRQLNGERQIDIKKAIQLYLPKEIPINIS